MSITDTVIDGWLKTKRGVRCGKELCRGDEVLYTSPRTGEVKIVRVVHIGPLVPGDGGGAEAASITITWRQDGEKHERNTTVKNLTRVRK